MPPTNENQVKALVIPFYFLLFFSKLWKRLSVSLANNLRRWALYASTIQISTVQIMLMSRLSPISLLRVLYPGHWVWIDCWNSDSHEKRSTLFGSDFMLFAEELFNAEGNHSFTTRKTLRAMYYTQHFFFVVYLDLLTHITTSQFTRGRSGSTGSRRRMDWEFSLLQEVVKYEARWSGGKAEGAIAMDFSWTWICLRD